MSTVVVAFVAFVIALSIVLWVLSWLMFPREIAETEWAQDIDYRRPDQRVREAGE